MSRRHLLSRASRSGRAPLLRRVAALTAVCCAALMPAAPLPAHAAAHGGGAAVSAQLSLPAQWSVPAEPPAQAAAVQAQVIALSTPVLTGEREALEDLTITVRVTNTDSEELPEVTLDTFMERQTPISPQAMEEWLSGSQRTTMMAIAPQESVGTLAPGESRDITVTAPASSLPLTDASQWGPRGIDVWVGSRSTIVTNARSYILWSPSEQEATALSMAVIVPLTASASEVEAYVRGVPEEVAQARTALLTRATALLSWAPRGVTVAVDPGLMSLLGVSAANAAADSAADAAGSSPRDPGEASTSDHAADSAGDSAAASGENSTGSSTTEGGAADNRTAGGAADSGSANGSSLSAQDAALRAEFSAALEEALASGHLMSLPWDDADISFLAHARDTARSVSAWQPATDADPRIAALPHLAWTAGLTDAMTVESLPATVEHVVVAPGQAPETDNVNFTPSGVETLGERTMLVPTPSLTSALNASGQLESAQMLRALSAVIARQAPFMERTMVVTLSREQAASLSAEEISDRLTALTSSPWISLRPADQLTELPGRGTVAREPLPESVSPHSVSAMQMLQASSISQELWAASSIMVPPEQNSPGSWGGVAAELPWWLLSNAWAVEGADRDTPLRLAQSRLEELRAQITVTPSSTINLISEQASLPVKIVSSLDREIAVVVHVDSSTQRLHVERDVTVSVPAGGSVTASVPVRAIGSGNATLTISVRSADGVVLGTDATIRLRVHANWENWGTAIIAIILGLMLVVGLIRTVRSGRRGANLPDLSLSSMPAAPDSAPSSADSIKE